MINHVRTLLLNEARTELDVRMPGEEFVPPQFHPIPEPAAVRGVRQLLFGITPDRYMLNYRLRQLMPLLHATELAEYVYEKDPRVTYWPLRAPLYTNTVFGPAYQRVAGDGDLAFVGQLRGEDATGRMRQQFRIDVLDNDTVQLERLTRPALVAETAYVLTAGRSQPIELPGIALSFTFSGGPGSAWLVTITAQPQRGAAELLADLKASTDAEQLFGGGGEEPYKTFYEIWRDSYDYGLQLGAVLLATAWRLDEARQ